MRLPRIYALLWSTTDQWLCSTSIYISWRYQYLHASIEAMKQLNNHISTKLTQGPPYLGKSKRRSIIPGARLDEGLGESGTPTTRGGQNPQ
ncbi:hypothetical protein BJX64DRAFT_77020 [Aspergillus heterothallicus]